MCLAERMAMKMKGFQIHTKAVQMEEYLKQAMHLYAGIQEKEVADITMIYDRPIQLCGDVLTVLENRVEDPEELATIQDIKRKYCRYHGYILSQLDEETLDALCEDLAKLNQETI